MVVPNNFALCGVFSCESLIVFVNLLAWFSLAYSVIRLGFICQFLLNHSDTEDDDTSFTSEFHRVRKHCLWEMVGMVLIAYEAILSFVLCIGSGSFFVEVKGFFVIIWCLNYPVFFIFHWVLGFFLTSCCCPQHRMKDATLENCGIVIVNLLWRGMLYWLGLNLLFHPNVTSGIEDKDMGLLNLALRSGGYEEFTTNFNSLQNFSTTVEPSLNSTENSTEILNIQ